MCSVCCIPTSMFTFYESFNLQYSSFYHILSYLIISFKIIKYLAIYWHFYSFISLSALYSTPLLTVLKYLGGGENPRELYITLHRSRTSRSRHPPILPLNPLNPFPDPEYPDFPPDPFNPPGIIGGDYDLYPFLNPRGGLRGGFRPRFDPPGPNFPRRGPPRFGPPGGGGFGGGFGGFF